MNILVAVNDAYVHPLAVMLGSLLYNNSDREIGIYLLYSNISKENLYKLQRLADRNGAVLHKIKIDPGYFARVPENGFSKETYYRLFAFKFLPENVGRILFLDPDMVVRGSLGGLYDMEIPDGYYFCAVADTSKGAGEAKANLKIPDGRTYFQSGTLLMDLNRIRKVFDEEKIFSYAEKKGCLLYYCDQDLLNVFFGENIWEIGKQYNYETRYHNLADIVGYFFKKIFSREDKAKIVHYMGAEKPWKKGYSEKYLDDFYCYARKAGVYRLCEYEKVNKYLYFINMVLNKTRKG